MNFRIELIFTTIAILLFFSVVLSCSILKNPASLERVSIRLHNKSDVDFDQVAVILPEKHGRAGSVVALGELVKGKKTEYVLLPSLNRLFGVRVTVDGKQYQGLRMCGTSLRHRIRPGRYTHELTLKDENCT